MPTADDFKNESKKIFLQRMLTLDLLASLSYLNFTLPQLPFLMHPYSPNAFLFRRIEIVYFNIPCIRLIHSPYF